MWPSPSDPSAGAAVRSLPEPAHGIGFAARYAIAFAQEPSDLDQRCSSRVCRARGETGRSDPPSHSMRSHGICVACRDNRRRVPQRPPQLATSERRMAVVKITAKLQWRPRPIYALPVNTRIQALRMVWPIVARRLEGMPNISAMQLFDELCIQFPGRFTPRQYPALLRRVNRWREDARDRGVAVVTKTYRVFNDKWSGRKRDIFADHWPEMLGCLEEDPDQTALELLVEFQVKYPGCYSQRQLHTLQKRVRVWRQQAVQRLLNEVSRAPNHASIQA